MPWKTESGWYTLCGLHETEKPKAECPGCARIPSQAYFERTILGEERRERSTYSTNPAQIQKTIRRREQRAQERNKI